MAECIFCKIVSGEIQSHVIADEPTFLAVLDIMPVRPGHTLIISKEHFPYFDDAPAEVITPITLFAQNLARIMKRRYGVERVAYFFTGGDFAHLHAHVVPMHEKTDITSRHYIAEEALTFRPVPRATDDVLRATAEKLRNELQRI